MMRRRRGFVPKERLDERPPGKRVRKPVTLSDGTVIIFDVLEIEPGADKFGDKAQPGYTDEHGRVPKRGSGA